MLALLMKPHGTYKIAHRRIPDSTGLRPRRAHREIEYDPLLDPILGGEPRLQRILDSLRDEIIEGGGGKNVRIRQVFREPREIYRLELQIPDLGYQRTTLLDRDALEELLATEEVRKIIHASALGR
jgi:hypothetical protein